MFFVSEIFESIQGEGNFAGANSIFVRFQYCNLTCSWCDTKYTWFADSGKFSEYSTSELIERIAKSKAPNVIFTGGEPTLYSLDKLQIPNKKIHIETNGILNPLEKLDIELHSNKHFVREAMNEDVISQFNWVVSPKLSNSRQPINKESLHFWNSKSYCIFKFIIRNTSDLEELNALVSEINILPSKIYVGLEGQTLESQLKPELVEAIFKAGYNYSPRLHVLLWGKERER
jgi:7-carboxy-7-deazaguanine synthase